MSVTRDITIWCDGDDCAEWEQGNAGENTVQTRQTIKRLGWARINGHDYCPDCKLERLKS